jgi:hypothetical protein
MPSGKSHFLIARRPKQNNNSKHFTLFLSLILLLRKNSVAAAAAESGCCFCKMKTSKELLLTVFVRSEILRSAVSVQTKFCLSARALANLCRSRLLQISFICVSPSFF